MTYPVWTKLFNLFKEVKKNPGALYQIESEYLIKALKSFADENSIDTGVTQYGDTYCLYSKDKKYKNIPKFNLLIICTVSGEEMTGYITAEEIKKI